MWVLTRICWTFSIALISDMTEKIIYRNPCLLRRDHETFLKQSTKLFKNTVEPRFLEHQYFEY